MNNGKSEKLTIEVWPVEKITGEVDVARLGKTRPVFLSGEVEGRSHFVYLVCPYCGALVFVDTDNPAGYTCCHCGQHFGPK